MSFGLRRRQTQEPWASPLARLMHGVRFGLTLLAATFLVVTVTPLTIWWAALLRGGDADPGTGKVMVVLAGSALADMLGESSYRRSAFAVREVHRGGYERILISGGGSGATPTSGPMKAFMVAAGVDSKIIELEDTSRSTHENAQFSAKRLQGEKRPIALVTSDFHMFRSARLFRKEGVPVVRRPYADASARAARWRNRWEIAYELAEETAKIIYYKLRGWI
jgi:uncharacterized SAM-binding protein YcdF (DUF218 family)